MYLWAPICATMFAHTSIDSVTLGRTCFLPKSVWTISCRRVVILTLLPPNPKYEKGPAAALAPLGVQIFLGVTYLI